MEILTESLPKQDFEPIFIQKMEPIEKENLSSIHYFYQKQEEWLKIIMDISFNISLILDELTGV